MNENIEQGYEIDEEFSADSLLSNENEIITSSESLIVESPGESIDSPSDEEEEEEYEPDFSAEINFPDEMISGEDADIEEGIEEGEEVPDDEISETEIVHDAQIQNENSTSFRSDPELSSDNSIDYSVQIAQIYERLENLEGETSIDELNETLISIDSNLEVLHSDFIALSNNQSFHSRLEIGILIALWASIIVYIAFSKIF